MISNILCRQLVLITLPLILSTFALSEGIGLSNLIHRTQRCEEFLIKLECLKLYTQLQILILIPGLGVMEH